MTVSISQPKAPGEAKTRQTSIGRSILMWFLRNGLLVVLVIEIAFFSIALKDKFVSPGVFSLIMQASTVIGIIMPFYACCLIAGQIDLSIVNVGNLGALVFAMFMLQDLGKLPVALALVIALAFAVLIGLVNSFLIIKVRVPSLVATLAVGALCAGLAYLVTDHFGGTYGQIKIVAPALRSLVLKSFMGTGLSFPVYLMFLLYILYYIILNHTKFGAHIYAVGGNAMAAHLAGIKITRVTTFCLVGSSFGVVLASVFLGVRLLTTGSAFTFSAASASTGASAIPVPLVAAVIAGVGLTGGTGNIWKTLLGVLFFSVLAIGMGTLNAPPQVRVATEGAAIVFAILLDAIRQRMETR